ncbi:D-alanyl-D-alanine carboxypeptidase [Thermoactinomyces sp. AMNI-1]|uniref:serine-type D-Ala-D-Ala carboxypeptidase n=1 Tax=Thermoactinomyces mirandus TaxID=2756294 RepID=A0A7W1XPL2_9BACL|nr:D-alanyl-D-alanine carboxypeptidase family protein [Thermoactinomyces mirandus]MBA4600958.1 D-alanyl-D-alanine carboxypeptidase [Thermoactinomyces mirandus]
MLKKFSFAIIALCMLVNPLLLPSKVQAKEAETDLAPEAVSAVLLDAGTGKILFEKNSHQALPPASITKVMTMLLVMEAIDRGKISWSDPVTISEHAASMGGSQIFLEQGERMTVHDLFKAMAVSSANDAAVALAEYLGGTEQNFVRMMNDKARELGLKNTHFQNANGLPAPDHYTSAYDIAVMSRELLSYPKVTNYTGLYEDYLRKNTKKPFWLVNTNKLIRFYPGMDGLKTGYTSEAKYCLAATAKRGNLRLIAVVMGEPDIKKRNQEVVSMLDYAFNHYTSKRIFNKGDILAEIRIDKGNPDKIRIQANQPLDMLIKKGIEHKGYEKRWIWNELKAPIHKGDRLGKLQIVQDGNIVAEWNLVSSMEIEQANLWTSLKRTLQDIFFLPNNVNSQM